MLKAVTGLYSGYWRYLPTISTRYVNVRICSLFLKRPEYIFLSPDRLSGRNNITLDKVNFIPDIGQNTFFFGKKSGYQEFVWLLKKFKATVP